MPAIYTQAYRRDSESTSFDELRDMVERHGLATVREWLDDIENEADDWDDRYLDDPRRGQARDLNRKF